MTAPLLIYIDTIDLNLLCNEVSDHLLNPLFTGNGVKRYIDLLPPLSNYAPIIITDAVCMEAVGTTLEGHHLCDTMPETQWRTGILPLIGSGRIVPDEDISPIPQELLHFGRDPERSGFNPGIWLKHTHTGHQEVQYMAERMHAEYLDDPQKAHYKLLNNLRKIKNWGENSILESLQLHPFPSLVVSSDKECRERTIALMEDHPHIQGCTNTMGLLTVLSHNGFLGRHGFTHQLSAQYLARSIRDDINEQVREESKNSLGFGIFYHPRADVLWQTALGEYLSDALSRETSQLVTAEYRSQVPEGCTASQDGRFCYLVPIQIPEIMISMKLPIQPEEWQREAVLMSHMLANRDTVSPETLLYPVLPPEAQQTVREQCKETENPTRMLLERESKTLELLSNGTIEPGEPSPHVKLARIETLALYQAVAQGKGL